MKNFIKNFSEKTKKMFVEGTKNFGKVALIITAGVIIVLAVIGDAKQVTGTWSLDQKVSSASHAVERFNGDIESEDYKQVVSDYSIANAKRIAYRNEIASQKLSESNPFAFVYAKFYSVAPKYIAEIVTVTVLFAAAISVLILTVRNIKAFGLVAFAIIYAAIKLVTLPLVMIAKKIKSAFVAKMTSIKESRKAKKASSAKHSKKTVVEASA